MAPVASCPLTSGIQAPGSSVEMGGDKDSSVGMDVE